MRESRTYGSGRGARGNSRPYREKASLLHLLTTGHGTWRFHRGAQNFDAIGGTADIDWPTAPIASEAYDPKRSSGCEFAATHKCAFLELL